MSTNKELGEEFFLTLSEGFQLARKAAEAIIEPMGITLAEYRLLRFVENSNRCTATQIRKRISATAPTVAHLVANLEAKGLIERITDKNDKRVQHIHLTSNGKRLTLVAKKKISALTDSLPIQKSVLHNAVQNVSQVITALSPSPSHYG